MHFNLNESKVIDGLENVGDYFSHNMSDHPLLQMEELRKLVRRLTQAGRKIFYSAGVKPESAIIGDGDTHPGQHPLDYAIDHMDNANAYMYILAPETDEVFKPLYLELNAELQGFCQRNGYQLAGERMLAIFISSPGGIAPHHIDHQHGFIAQIKGTKTLYQWPANNLELTTPEELEVFFARISRELAIKDEFESLRTPYVISPGKGAYIPFAAPHSVINGDEVSISLSVVFNTTDTQRIQNIYRANHFLRNTCHLSPNVPGETPWKDALKDQYFRAYDYSLSARDMGFRGARKLGRILRRNSPRIL